MENNDNKIVFNLPQIEDKESEAQEINFDNIKPNSVSDSTHSENDHHHHRHHHRHSGEHSHHGDEHHHHRSKHHHRHSSHKKKKKKSKARLIWSVLAVLLVLIVLIVFVYKWENTHESHENTQNTTDISSDILNVEIINEDAVLIKEAVKKYLQADLLNSYGDKVKLSDFSVSSERLDVQVPVSLKLSVDQVNALSYKIELADNENFENSEVSFIEGAAVTHNFEHLFVNTKYYYRVTVYHSKGTETVTGNFHTADTPRILSIDGVSNVRDIGNWRTDTGKRIKQGLLIRGTEIDGAVESNYCITNDGIIDMLKTFGIKTDMDLRLQTPLCKDALGSRVEHIYYDMVMYASIIDVDGKEKIRQVFADLSDPENYPIYMHCTYGRDRTGTVCYLLETLLGVSRGDCLKDYGLSNASIDNILELEEELKKYEGTTLKEQTESYLISCGVTEYQIESIRNIFLGD